MRDCSWVKASPHSHTGLWRRQFSNVVDALAAACTCFEGPQPASLALSICTAARCTHTARRVCRCASAPAHQSHRWLPPSKSAARWRPRRRRTTSSTARRPSSTWPTTRARRLRRPSLTTRAGRKSDCEPSWAPPSTIGSRSRTGTTSGGRSSTPPELYCIKSRARHCCSRSASSLSARPGTTKKPYRGELRGCSPSTPSTRRRPVVNKKLSWILINLSGSSRCRTPRVAPPATGAPTTSR